MQSSSRWVRLILLALLVLPACAASASPKLRADRDAASDDVLPGSIADDWDEAEARWRSEIAAERWSDEDDSTSLLHPARKASASASANREQTMSDARPEDAPPAAPPTRWGRFKSGAETVGRASFAALTVFVTLGMMVAPYLLL